MSSAPLLVAAGLLGQGALLVPLAGTGAAAGLRLAAGAALAGVLAALAWPRLARPARASLAMLAAGGFGMTLGWWADLGFGSAAAAGPDAAAWCGLAPGAAAADALAMALGMSGGAALAVRVAPSLSAEAAVVSAHALMNAGMLAGMQLAVLARIARRRPVPRGLATRLPAPL